MASPARRAPEPVGSYAGLRFAARSSRIRSARRRRSWIRSSRASHQARNSSGVSFFFLFIVALVLAGLLIARVDFIEFSFPTTQVIVFAIAAILVGILAAIFPARRAAKLNPLEALHYE